MKNLIKKIGIGLAVSSFLGLVSCATLPKYPQYKHIPKEMLDFVVNEKYIVETSIESGILSLRDGIHYYRNFDLDGDGDGDIGIVYNPNYENPRFYGFNMNDNQSFDEDEIWVDDKYDGFNGNEIRFDKWIIEKDKELNHKINSKKYIV